LGGEKMGEFLRPFWGGGGGGKAGGGGEGEGRVGRLTKGARSHL